MHRWIRGIARGLGILLVLAAGLMLFREEIVLGGVRLMTDLTTDIGPPREVEWSTGPDPRGRPANERPPNIVVILADDLGWNDVGFTNGDPARATIPTPNIDRIAAEGVQFTSGYAANATCAPSRAALMSGRYGTRFGFEYTPTPQGMMQIVPLVAAGARGTPDLRERVVHDEGESVPYDDMGMPPSEITIAELLAEQDYHTVHIGKWHLGRTGGMAPHEQGFEESLLMASGLYLPEDDPEVVNSKQAFDGIDKFLWARMDFAASFNGGPMFAPERYLTDYYTDQAVEVIEANADRPFFLYLAHWAPHTPLQALRADYEALSHIELHRERVYAAMIRSLDRGVGRVLDALEAQGLAENTLVVFTSDNGGAGYIGLPDVNDPYRGWKMTFFEGGIHVPFAARWPARIPAGTTFADPVHHFDVYATAAAAGGADMPTDREMDGVDLLPFVRGEAEGVPHRSLFWSSGASKSAIVDGWKLNVSRQPGVHDRVWLFDLSRDPAERWDLSVERPDKVAALESALAAHMAEQRPPAWPPQLTAPANLDKDGSQPDAPDDEYVYWTN